MNERDANILSDIEEMIRLARMQENKLYREIRFLKIQTVILFIALVFGVVMGILGIKVE